MTNLIIIIYVVQFIFLIGSIIYASRSLGQNELLRKMVVESKRREKRLQFEIRLWQDKLTQKAGLGLVHRTKDKNSSGRGSEDDSVKTGRNFVSPSEAITRQKKKDAENPPVKVGRVPPSVREEFLRDSAEIDFAGGS